MQMGSGEYRRGEGRKTSLAGRWSSHEEGSARNSAQRAPIRSSAATTLAGRGKTRFGGAATRSAAGTLTAAGAPAHFVVIPPACVEGAVPASAE